MQGDVRGGRSSRKGPLKVFFFIYVYSGMKADALRERIVFAYPTSSVFSALCMVH